MATKEEVLQERLKQHLAMAKQVQKVLEAHRKATSRKNRVEARKARTRALIACGGLCEVAGMLEVDSGTLLGLLLGSREALADPAQVALWKHAGDAELARRSAQKSRKTETAQESAPGGLSVEDRGLSVRQDGEETEPAPPVQDDAAAPPAGDAAPVGAALDGAAQAGTDAAGQKDGGLVMAQPVSVPIPTGEADGAQQALETLMERLDYGAEGCTAADRAVVSALVARFGAQQVGEEIDRLKLVQGRVFPSTVRKALGG